MNNFKPQPAQRRNFCFASTIATRTLKNGLLVVCLLAASSKMSAAESPIPRFIPVIVDTNISIGYGVTVADVDGDGRADILLADQHQFVWYRNPTWDKYILAENLTKLDNVCIAASDIDGDGKAEIAVGAGWNPGDTLNSGAVFYLVQPKDRRQRWEPVELPHEPTVHRMRWVKQANGKYDLVVVPLHGRGNKNGEGAGVRILAYTAPSDPKQPWATAVVNESFHMTHNFEAWPDNAGIAREMLVACREGVFKVALHDSKDVAQLAQPISSGAGEVRIGHLSGAKLFFATVEPMHGTNLVVYTAPAEGATGGARPFWNRHVLDSSLAEGHALACGDLLGLGWDQIVVGWRGRNRPEDKVGIKLFTPLDPDGGNWKETLIDDNTMACEDLCLADVNGDGRLDIVAGGRATKNLKIYFNQGAK
jgi:hypothetical protein